MSSRIVVGYTATKAGRDAVAVAGGIAAASGSELDIVLVLPGEGRSVITPPDASYDRYLLGQAESWLAEAAASVQTGVVHREHARYAESFAEGLVEAADEFGATHLVVGAADGGARGRHRLGSTTSQLLHSSDVPVVLVPRGARKRVTDAGVPRLTVAVGTRAGADVLLEEAVALASATGASLRLVSLVTVDLPASVDTGVIRLAGAAHAEQVLTDVLAAIPEGVRADIVTAKGDSIEDAVAHLDWLPGELILVGSSRLAQPRRLFLGSVAAKLLSEIPVPMVVVPRTRTTDPSR
ncbi:MULTISPECIES: universal stress protein [Microbacterium]|uniref:universal stress protein n=1 Tax=Microbacterium TaxID=33882 RepID=UPI00037684B8|nr:MULTISPECIES: universal stress protein [unclassified Microbacterium]MDT3345916.1 universal stress protein [Microbacterium sp. KSW2-22]SDG86810.1 Nucleotide-binding universal stress protein, UspA family [Microbacterium sp. 77mftsu3.1]